MIGACQMPDCIVGFQAMPLHGIQVLRSLVKALRSENGLFKHRLPLAVTVSQVGDRSPLFSSKCRVR